MLGEWIESHPEIRQYVTMSIASSSIAKDPKFQRRRNATHRQLIAKLESFQSSVEQEKTKKEKELQNESLMSVRKVGPLVYSESEKRMNVRKAVFVSRTLQARKVQLISKELMEAIGLTEELRQLIENLKNPAFVPEARTLEISDSYFVFPRPSQSKDRLKFEIEALNRNLRLRDREIDRYRPPSWFSSFNEVMRHVLGKSKAAIIENLSYSPPVEAEVDLSRYVWVYDESHKVSGLLDSAADEVIAKRDAASLQSVVELCCSLIPNGDSRPLDEQSLGLVILFRVFFDRLYERYSKSVFDLGSDEDARLMDKLGARPLDWFHMPDCVVKAVKNPHDSVRTCVREDEGLWEAVNALNTVMFMTNPIDALYHVHLALMSMHNVGITRESDSPDDGPKLMCFDDLFSVVVGVGVSSDVSGFSALASFLDTFAPESCLSNPFEYAQAAVAAFASHCRMLGENIE